MKKELLAPAGDIEAGVFGAASVFGTGNGG